MHVHLGPLGDLPGSRGRPAEIADEIVETTVRAEELGFDGAWVGERHFVPECVMISAPFALLSAMAAATERIRLGTSVALVPLHHPVQLVERVATVDALSDGRVTLGTGIGYLDEEYDAFGVDRRRRVARVLDAVEFFDATEDHEPVSFEGREYDLEGVRIEPAFTQEPRPPIWMGGTVPDAMERAARVGDGYLGLPAGPDFYRQATDVIESTLEDDADFEVCAMVNAFVADTTAEARETVEPGLDYLEYRYSEWQDRERRPVDPATDPGVYGTPEEVVEGLSVYRDILGADAHLLVRLHYPDVPRRVSDDAMTRFADEVLPAL